MGTNFNGVAFGLTVRQVNRIKGAPSRVNHHANQRPRPSAPQPTGTRSKPRRP